MGVRLLDLSSSLISTFATWLLALGFGLGSWPLSALGSWLLSPLGSRLLILALGSRDSALISWLLALGSWLLALGSWLLDLGSRLLALCSLLFALAFMIIPACPWFPFLLKLVSDVRSDSHC